MARGVFNEFTRQMFRGTSAQGAVFGEESVQKPTQSVTGLQPKTKRLAFGKQLSGASEDYPRGNLGDELERVGIDAYDLEVRSEVPEYTFQYKKILGELAKRNIEPLLQKKIYKALPMELQKAAILAGYKGVSGLTEEEKRAYRGLGFVFDNIKQVTSNTIKTKMPFLQEMHNFRKNYTKDEIRQLYKDRKEAGDPIPQLKYVGEETTDRGKNYAAIEQNNKLETYKQLINKARKEKNILGGRYTIEGQSSGMRDGGYVTQMSALGL